MARDGKNGGSISLFVFVFPGVLMNTQRYILDLIALHP
jgi:hypothetical protein